MYNVWCNNIFQVGLVVTNEDVENSELKNIEQKVGKTLLQFLARKYFIIVD